jgi:ATP-binding cassette, subfamily B, bacterial MsbA
MYFFGTRRGAYHAGPRRQLDRAALKLVRMAIATAPYKHYRQFIRLCARTVAAQPWLFAGFLVLTTGAAVSEGFGVGLLIPLLQAAAPGESARMPWLDGALGALLPAAPGMRTAALAGLLAGVIVLRGALQVAASWVAIALPIGVQTRLSCATYDTMLDTGLEFFAHNDGGILRTLVLDYPQRLASAIKSITDVIANLLLALIYAALMLAVSWRVSLVATALVGTLGLGVKYLLTLPLGRTGEALSSWQERWNTLIYETGLGLKLIRLLGAEPMLRRSYRSVIANYFRYDARRQLIAEAYSPLITSLGGLLVCVTLIYGSVAAIGVDAAQLLVLVLCLYRLMTPVSRILTNFVIINTNLDALQRQEEFACSTAIARPLDGKRPFEHLREGIVFKGVTFCYPRSDRTVLNGLDLTIARGEMIALVGPSGAGKTSIVNLLGRLYDPQRGRIEIDGDDLRHYQIAAWRKRIAVVTQDITLFNMSVAENISFGLEGISRRALDHAAAQAAASDFIAELPEGWDTRLGDRGVRLSGGQQQRLSIARAILRDPDLLILDEATSQLDTITEHSIQRLIESYRGRGTILVIAHRLSTVRRADRIAVMRNGSVVECGSHQELAARQSAYRSMLDAHELDVMVDQPV